MGLVSIGGNNCTLSLCTKTYEGPFGYIMGEECESGPGHFRSQRHVTYARRYYGVGRDYGG